MFEFKEEKKWKKVSNQNVDKNWQKKNNLKRTKFLNFGDEFRSGCVKML